MASKSTIDHAYAVVMAGGSGTRFWPASRRSRPKQLLEGVFGTGTLLEGTLTRIRPLVPAKRTYIFTNTLLKRQIEKLLPDVPRAQIVAEPAARNTAPTLGLAAHEILKHDPDGLMVILPADHLIEKPAAFRRALRVALHYAAVPGRSLLVGLEPASPHTGFGYIHRGEAAATVDGQSVYKVESFKEKPSPEVAAEYVASGEYLWNGGMFIWRADTLVANLERFMPAMARDLAKIARAGGAASSALDRIYPKLEKISIDYAVAEKADEVYVVAADLGWRDVGSWSEVYALRPKDADGNARPKLSLCLNAQGNLIVADKFVAAVGVNDLIIVETPDAIVVANRNQAQDVGKAVAAIEKLGLKKLL